MDKLKKKKQYKIFIKTLEIKWINLTEYKRAV